MGSERTMVPAARWASLKEPGNADAQSSDNILNEVDTGGARNGVVILHANFAAASDITNVEVWTSAKSNFLIDGTTGVVSASDGQGLCTLASDKSNLFAEAVAGGSISDLTVSANAISTIDQDGMYIIGVKNVSRYLNVQYDGGTAGHKLSAVFIGEDPVTSPWGGAQAAY